MRVNVLPLKLIRRASASAPTSPRSSSRGRTRRSRRTCCEFINIRPDTINIRRLASSQIFLSILITGPRDFVPPSFSQRRVREVEVSSREDLFCFGLETRGAGIFFLKSRSVLSNRVLDSTVVFVPLFLFLGFPENFSRHRVKEVEGPFRVDLFCFGLETRGAGIFFLECGSILLHRVLDITLVFIALFLFLSFLENFSRRRVREVEVSSREDFFCFGLETRGAEIFFLESVTILSSRVLDNTIFFAMLFLFLYRYRISLKIGETEQTRNGRVERYLEICEIT